VITLCAILAVAVAAGEWAAFAGAGGRAARHTHGFDPDVGGEGREPPRPTRRQTRGTAAPGWVR